MLPVGHVLPLRIVAGALHVHHRLRGPRGDYVGIGAAAFASWAGLPGPGEAALITGGILAGHNRLDAASVIAVAWLGAMIGGIIGWAIGLRAGRTVLTARGPLHSARLSALERGDRFYERFGAVAVFFTPSWVAGIHGMRPLRFVVANALSALVWALLIGLGAYLVGPPIQEFVDDLGLVGVILVVGLAVGAVVGLVARGRRRRARATAAQTESE